VAFNEKKILFSDWYNEVCRMGVFEEGKEWAII